MKPKKTAFVSLGPACFTSGILNRRGFKNCSYPLDNCRSGSNQLKDLFYLSPRDFYWRHIHEPNITLIQNILPSEENDNIVEVEKSRPIYGFPYFYNPHREIGTNKEYHLRTLNRFKDVINNGDVYVHFLIADRYPGGEAYFGLEESVAFSFISETLRDALANRCYYQFTMCRTTSTADTTIRCEKHTNVNNDRLFKIYLHEDNPYWREIAGKCIYSRGEHVCTDLYTPDASDINAGSAHQAT